MGFGVRVQAWGLSVLGLLTCFHKSGENFFVFSFVSVEKGKSVSCEGNIAEEK